MRVPFFKQPFHGPDNRDSLLEGIQRVINHGQFILGPEVEQFEKSFAEFCSADQCIGVGNGCEALSLLLQVLEIGKGHEVIVPANTFIGTVLPIIQVGAIPVFVDCSSVDSNIDISLIERAITPNTRAIVPVHLYGRPAQMDQILAISKTYDLEVIEDAAQAHGATWKGQRCGSIAQYATFSFYPTKNLGAFGDAGAVVTSNKQVADKLRIYRNYGQSQKYHHDYEGRNSRLDAIQASVILGKLKFLDHENAKRREFAEYYKKRLVELPLSYPIDSPGTEPVYHLFVVLTPLRDKLRKHLADNGVETGIHYPIPCHFQKGILPYVKPSTCCPEAERQSRELLSLPMHASMKQDELEYVVNVVRTFF